MDKTVFESQLMSMIDERVEVMFEIERVLFTKRYRLAQKHSDIFTVQSIAMIYSIWEGFVQQSFQLYCTYINEQTVDFKELSDEIRIFHMENTFKQLREYPGNNKRKISFFENLDSHFSQPYHELSRLIDTQSNVGFEVLNKLLITFSLEPFSKHWNVYRHPDPNLESIMKTFLRYRNGVAHGGDISSEEKVTAEVYVRYKKLVTDLMYEIHIKFINGIDDQTYLKPV